MYHTEDMRLSKFRSENLDKKQGRLGHIWKDNLKRFRGNVVLKVWTELARLRLQSAVESFQHTNECLGSTKGEEFD